MGVAPEDPRQIGSTGGGGPLTADELAQVHLRLEVSGRRADVVLVDPDRHNPQTPAMWRALAALARWLDGRADIVVIRGEGPSFSAGLDRAAFSPSSTDGLARLAMLDDEAAAAEIAGFQDAFRHWSTSSYLSIAAVRGHAIGAGFQLALACDLRLAADDARFSMREPQLGLVPDLGGTARLVEAVGYGRALEICASGRDVPAAEALQCGLVQRVVEFDALARAVDDLAVVVTGEQSAAVLATRDLLRRARPDLTDQLAAERIAQVRRIQALAARAGLGK